ncbi:uncharacterized protein K02A2.6-like [Uranotaenia lowii]|uniref:uncharacterized protein K02A2.6-like n=1 Tax=Uranotaenia lowii TaxID=190385 RepID=UPI002479986A|nr:uncharacterized protein K02A2.6-like [Uranotaenia lowii]
MCERLGIIHIRIAPFHPQSNGQAERFVDTLKRSLQKITEGEGVPAIDALQTFLQVYRSTPSAVLDGKSPAEGMLGRPMRTTLELLKPPSVPKNMNKVLPSKYTTGSKVYIKVYKNSNKWKWVPGEIIEEIGNVNFNVLLDIQVGRRKLIRTHLNQLRPRFETAQAEDSETATNSPLNILKHDFHLDHLMPLQQSQPNDTHQPKDDCGSESESDEFFQSAAELSIPHQSTPVPCEKPRSARPTRTIRPPQRFNDYIMD